MFGPHLTGNSWQSDNWFIYYYQRQRTRSWTSAAQTIKATSTAKHTVLLQLKCYQVYFWPAEWTYSSQTCQVIRGFLAAPRIRIWKMCIFFFLFVLLSETNLLTTQRPVKCTFKRKIKTFFLLKLLYVTVLGRVHILKPFYFYIWIDCIHSLVLCLSCIVCS